MSLRNRYKKFERASLLGEKCCQLKSAQKLHCGPFFKFLGNQSELERTETTKNFFDAGVSF